MTKTTISIHFRQKEWRFSCFWEMFTCKPARKLRKHSQESLHRNTSQPANINQHHPPSTSGKINRRQSRSIKANPHRLASIRTSQHQSRSKIDQHQSTTRMWNQIWDTQPTVFKQAGSHPSKCFQWTNGRVNQWPHQASMFSKNAADGVLRFQMMLAGILNLPHFCNLSMPTDSKS